MDGCLFFHQSSGHDKVSNGILKIDGQMSVKLDSLSLGLTYSSTSTQRPISNYLPTSSHNMTCATENNILEWAAQVPPMKIEEFWRPTQTVEGKVEFNEAKITEFSSIELERNEDGNHSDDSGEYRHWRRR
jgi:hypothetical protein